MYMYMYMYMYVYIYIFIYLFVLKLDSITCQIFKPWNIEAYTLKPKPSSKT